MSEAILTTDGLSKSFGALCATNDVSIELRPGEIHALIGPNGAGKTTLVAQICGSLRADRGRITLLGRDVTALSTAERAYAGLGRTFQISALAMEDTVLENAVLGVLGASGKPWRFWSRLMSQNDLVVRAETALERVGLIAMRHKVCAELSHGQRRLLEVAIALTLAPKALVMDEPMAGLGAEGVGWMTHFLDDLRTESPILLIEHDMDVVFTLADRISVMVQGRLIETGSVAQIRASKAVQAAYLGTGT